MNALAGLLLLAPMATLDYPRHIVRWIPGCADVELGPLRSESDEFTVSSTPIVKECRLDPDGVSICREVPGKPNLERLRLVIKDRGEVPSGEIFRVHLNGWYTRIQFVRVHQSYLWQRQGDQLILWPAGLHP